MKLESVNYLSKRRANGNHPEEGDSQREERKAATHVGHTHTHSHTLIFMTSFCEMVLSKVIASKQTLLPKRGTGEPCTKQARMLDRRMAGVWDAYIHRLLCIWTD